MSLHDSRPTAPRDACDAGCPLAGALDRRTFLSQTMLAAAAAALAACGAGGDSLTAPSTIDSSLNVSSYPALASTGGIAVVSVSGTRIALVRTSASSIAALSLVCPHEGGSINQSGTGFLCSKHGARFSGNGTWTGGERTTNMHSYPTTFDTATGTITIG